MCTRPITVFVRGSKSVGSEPHSYLVPCGKCCECKKRYQNDWKIRIFEQIKDSGNGVFVTLTYAPENVPLLVDTETGECNKTVYKKHCQDWIKRMRIGLERSGKYDREKFSYFLTSEYGPRTFRPHYHCIIMGVSYMDIKPYLDDWKNRFGYFSCDPRGINKAAGSAAYVAKYCSKGVFECPLVAQGKVLPTFHLMSKGIGEGYIRRMRAFHLTAPFMSNGFVKRQNWYYSKRYLEYVADNLCYRNPAFQIRGETIRYALPKYYKTKIFGRQIIVKNLRNGKPKKALCKTALQAQLSDFLFKRNVEVRDSQCREIQRQFGYKSYGEALAHQEKDEAWLLERREKDARESLERFYNKSKL